MGVVILFKKPVKGKKAKTISCKSAHPDKKIAKIVYKKPDIKGASSAEIVEQTSYMHVMEAYVEGASVKRKQVGNVNDDITLSKLFDKQGDKSDQRNSGIEN